MKTMRNLGLAILLLASSQVALAIGVIPNMSFETDFSGWTPDPIANVTRESALGANQGTYYAQINGSGSLSRTGGITLLAGETYEFMWRFITGNSAGADKAVIVKEGDNTVLNINLSSVASDTGWLRFSWVALGSTGPLSFNLTDFGSPGGSKLLLDAVPLPVAPLLFGTALLGFGALRKKLMAKPVDLATA